MIDNRIFRNALGLGALALFALVPVVLHTDLEFTTAFALALVFGLGVLSVVVLTGYAGQVSLCQATFMGISAFATGALVSHGVNYFIAAIGGTLVAFFLGVAVGIPALRLRGILLAVVTIGVAISFDYFFFQDVAFSWFNGGLGGWTVDEAHLFGLTLSSIDADHVRQIYWMILAVFFLITLLVVNLHDSGSGRRFRAIRDSELAAATMGVDLTRYKLLAFGLSAAIAGVGGSFYPLLVGKITNGPFNFVISLQLAAIAVLMGIRFIPGAFLGGLFVSVIPRVLPHLQDFLTTVLHRPIEIKNVWFNLVLGALLVLQMILYPDGVWGDLAGKVRHGILHAFPGAGKTAVGKPTKVVTT
ncbi:MAG TPA: branched-chain amino acid ABC transporter permease [Candidatus Dormibacteraeota bacterium]